MDIVGNDIIGQRAQNLTDPELNVLVALADGKTPSQIQNQLNIDGQQLRDHESQIRAKLGASSKPHMISRAFVLGVLMPRALCFMLAVTTAFTSTDDGMRLRRPSQVRSTRQITRIVRTGRTGGGRQYS